MSNRPKPHRSAPPSAGAAADRRRVMLIAGALGILVVVVGIIVALAGGTDSTRTTGTTGSSDDRPIYGPVSVDGTPLASFTSTAEDAARGERAPLVQGTTPDGAGISVGGAGEPSVVAFMAHWCPHCQRELPLLVDLMAQGELEGVRMVAVLTGTDPARPNFPPVPWLEREEWAGEVLLDDDESTAGQAYGLGGFPFLVFLDADGNVVARTSGEVGAADLLSLVDMAR